WTAWQHLAGRMLEFNDIGYLERKNDYQATLALNYRTLEPWWRTVQTTSGPTLNLRRSLDGLTLWNELKWVETTQFKDFSWITFDLHGRGRYFDDRETGDGTALERAASAGGLIDIASDPRRQVTGGLTGT